VKNNPYFSTLRLRCDSKSNGPK